MLALSIVAIVFLSLLILGFFVRILDGENVLIWALAVQVLAIVTIALGM